MKFNIFKAMLICAPVVALSACSDDFLDVENPTGDPIEDYYTTDEHVQEALIAAYAPTHTYDWDGQQYSPINMMAELAGDNFWIGGADKSDNSQWHSIFNFEADAQHTLSSVWRVSYWGVKRCNDVIYYLDNYVPDGTITPEKEASYRMQARLLRAYYYNTLWHFFGNIPYYTENVQTPPYTAPQMRADEVYANIVTELEQIITSGVLPLKYYKDANGNIDETQLGRVTQGLAYMLYAEAVMYQNDESRFSQALSYMREMIQSPDFDLVDDFASIWTTAGEWSIESVWEINFASENHERCWDWPISAGGTILPTLIAPNSYGGDDLWGGGDGWGFFPVRTETRDMYSPTDERLAATVWDASASGYTKRYQDTGLWLAKYRPLNGNMPTDFDGLMNYNNNLRVYRYSEVLLNAAELYVRTGGSETGEAKTWLNLVRQRANVSGHERATLDNILTERHLEFVGEGKRAFDLVRCDNVSGVSDANRASTVLVPDDYGYRTHSWSPSKKHIPIAQSEIDADPALVQNNY